MSTRKKTYNRYGTAVKEAVIASRNTRLFPRVRIPRSTAHHWIRYGIRTPNDAILASSLKSESLALEELRAKLDQKTTMANLPGLEGEIRTALQHVDFHEVRRLLPAKVLAARQPATSLVMSHSTR